MQVKFCFSKYHEKLNQLLHSVTDVFNWRDNNTFNKALETSMQLATFFAREVARKLKIITE